MNDQFDTELAALLVEFDREAAATVEVSRIWWRRNMRGITRECSRIALKAAIFHFLESQHGLLEPNRNLIRSIWTDSISIFAENSERFLATPKIVLKWKCCG